MEYIKKLLRNFLSQKFINNFYHLPEAVLANIVYGFPSHGMTVIGVTGTDGKTTTVNMIYQILKSAGKKVSMVSTINAVIAGKLYDTGFHVTSPDPFMIQKFAKEARDHGDRYLVLETTSHALDQFRFWGIKFEVGVITNVTHEHLDYHKTWENYFLTKAKLIKSVKFAVINKDEKHFDKLSRKTLGKVANFGFSENADFNPQNFPLKLKMLGEYNVLNSLAAVAATSSLGIDQKLIQDTLNNFDNLSGRMEEIKNIRGIRIIVDFAHTPNALEQALGTLRKQIEQSSRVLRAKGKLISVFGCAGLRDVGKRSLMGGISGKLSDITIITSEDPRGQLDNISKQIMDGAIKAGAKLNKNLFVINDRAEAIKFAISLAKKRDTIGIFGKGHEKSMNLDGKSEISWSDQDTVRKILKNG